MGGYKTVVVGTDGSDSSMRAVDRAAQLASGPDSRLILVTAFIQGAEDHRAQDVLKDESYKATGHGPAFEILHDARDRAQTAGATNIEERAVDGAPVDVLVDVVVAEKADLLVVGNLGLSSIAGRLLGSVPANVARRAKSDVLIVHTTG